MHAKFSFENVKELSYMGNMWRTEYCAEQAASYSKTMVQAIIL